MYLYNPAFAAAPTRRRAPLARLGAGQGPRADLVGWARSRTAQPQIVSGDTFYAVVEFSAPVRGEALIGYGNWSREGLNHITDQLELASQSGCPSLYGRMVCLDTQ